MCQLARFSSESVQGLFLASLHGIQNIWSGDETNYTIENRLTTALELQNTHVLACSNTKSLSEFLEEGMKV